LPALQAVHALAPLAENCPLEHCMHTSRAVRHIATDANPLTFAHMASTLMHVWALVMHKAFHYDCLSCTVTWMYAYMMVFSQLAGNNPSGCCEHICISNTFMCLGHVWQIHACMHWCMYVRKPVHSSQGIFDMAWCTFPYHSYHVKCSELYFFKVWILIFQGGSGTILQAACI
jgi:hypothetical protein